MNCCERDPGQLEHKHEGVPDLRALLALMRDARAVKVKMPNGLEVELSPLAFALPSRDEHFPPAPVGIENGGEPTEEQLMQWSVQGPLPAAQQPEAWPSRDSPESV